MPTIIDRYLVRQFVLQFLICYISLSGLFTVVDVFTNLDSYLELARKEDNALVILARFYGFRWLSFLDMTSSVLALIAAMFTMSAFQSKNELTALLAAGVAKGRVALPVIVAAGAIAVLAAVGREAVLPRFASELNQEGRDLTGEASQQLTPRYDHQTDILMDGASTIARTRQIRKPSFQLPDLLSSYGTEMAAEDAFYETPTADHPGGYRLRGVTKPDKVASRLSLTDGNRTLIYYPRDAAWLKPGESFVVSTVDFDQLRGGGSWRYQSVSRLIASLGNKSFDYGADVRVAIHGRFVKPLLDMNLLFLGLPLVLARDNRNIFLAIALCLGVVAVFLLTVYACQYLGSAVYLSPHFAAWLPLMIFTPLAVAMSRPFSE